MHLDLLRAMTATMFAIMLRMADENGHRQIILKDLRRNILLTVAKINPGADEQARLSHEERTDSLLDELLRLARNS